MRHWLPFAALTAMSLFGTMATAVAAEWRVSGQFGVETRFFPEDAAFPGQDDTHLSGSIFAEPELRVDFDSGQDQLTLVPFARYDTADDDRTHADLREANWLRVGDGWDLVVGIDRVFWG